MQDYREAVDPQCVAERERRHQRDLNDPEWLMRRLEEIENLEATLKEQAAAARAENDLLGVLVILRGAKLARVMWLSYYARLDKLLRN